MLGFLLEFSWFRKESSNQESEPVNSFQSVPSVDFPDTELPFVDRRQGITGTSASNSSSERRQFGNSYHNLTEEGRVLAEAIDSYKLEHRRRYITTDELISVLKSLGYSR